MELWPRGAWFGLTRPRLRIVSLVFVPMAIAALLVLGPLLALVHYRAWQARQLISEIQTLQPGQPLPPRIRALAQSVSVDSTGKELCEPDCWYLEYYVDSFHHGSLHRLAGSNETAANVTTTLVHALDREPFHSLGIREWEVMAEVVLREGRTHRTQVRVFVEGKDHQYLGAVSEYRAEMGRRISKNPPSDTLGVVHPANLDSQGLDF